MIVRVTRVVARLLLLLAFAMTTTATAANATAYRVDYVCALDQYNGRLTDINNRGQIVGYTDTGSQKFRSFVWQNGHCEDMGTLGGDATWAKAINDDGLVAGWSTTSNVMPYVAMTWQKGQMSRIGNLGGAYSSGNDINNNGVVAGNSQLSGAGGNGYVYTWLNGVASNSKLIGEGTGINDLDEVVVAANSRAYIWRNNAATDLGGLGGNTTRPQAINNKSQVVGYSNVDSIYWHAFLWQNGTISDLGTGSQKYSMAADINDSGLVVGNYGFMYHACMWKDGMLIDLNSLLPANSGWTLVSADGVNNLGQIVGKGIYNGQYSGFLFAPVPEPSSIVALVSGLATLCWCCRRRRRE